MSEQIVFGATEFANNPESRCPVILLLDTSGSMSGEPIRSLNLGVEAFKDELATDSLAAKRVEVSVISFGPVKIESEFQGVELFYPPRLDANGDTPLGAAIELAVQTLTIRKAEYKANGISFYRPWIILITDGTPTDNYVKAQQLVHEGESKKSFAFFPIGVHGANMDILSSISVRSPLMLDGLKFKEFFLWLSSSLKSVSRSSPGEEVPLAQPTGWASV